MFTDLGGLLGPPAKSKGNEMMDAKTRKLIVDELVIPVIAELMKRRGVRGVTKENLEKLTVGELFDPAKLADNLKNNPGLRKQIVEDIADGIDNVASPFIDAAKSIIVSATGGLILEDDT